MHLCGLGLRGAMKLTSFTDFSLRVLIFLATDPVRRATIAEVASAFDISENHLTKVVHFLGKEGLIINVRGKGGGMRLAHAPGDINLGAVVRSIEPDFALVECFATGTRCVLTGRCRLASVLGGAMQKFMAHLDGVTLADLLPVYDRLLRHRIDRGTPVVGLGGGVVTEFRGRGVYRALLAARMAEAAKRKATLALVKARTSSSSPILRRAGFTSYGTECHLRLIVPGVGEQ